MQKWIKSEYGEMNFENICRVYSSNKDLILKNQPPSVRAINVIGQNKNYTIRWNRYEKATNFFGSSNGSNYFVLKGNCEIIFNEKTYKFQEGDCFEFPKGDFEFKNIGDDCFEYVAVYELPDNIRVKY